MKRGIQEPFPRFIPFCVALKVPMSTSAPWLTSTLIMRGIPRPGSSNDEREFQARIFVPASSGRKKRHDARRVPVS